MTGRCEHGGGKLKIVKTPKPPRVLELRIRLLHEKRQLSNGCWRFVPVLPNEGTPGCYIVAPDSRTARGLLEGWIYNELSAEGFIEEDTE